MRKCHMGGFFDLHQTTTPKLVRMDQKTNCIELAKLVSRTRSTYPVVNISSDVEGLAQAEASGKDTGGSLLLPVHK